MSDQDNPNSPEEPARESPTGASPSAPATITQHRAQWISCMGFLLLACGTLLGFPLVTGIILAAPVATVLKVGVGVVMTVLLLDLLVRRPRQARNGQALSKNEKRVFVKTWAMLALQMVAGYYLERSSLASFHVVVTCLILNCAITGLLMLPESNQYADQFLDANEFRRLLFQRLKILGAALAGVCAVLSMVALYLFVQGVAPDSSTFIAFIMIAFSMVVLVELPFAMSYFVYLFFTLGAFPIVASFVEHALKVLPSDPFLLYLRGAACLGMGQYEDAEKYCTMALEELPDRFDIFLNRGYARFKQGKLELAEQDLAQAIELEPNCTEAYLSRSKVRLAMGDEQSLALALEDACRAVELEPNIGAGYYMRSRVYLKLERLEECQADVMIAMKLPGDYRSVSYGMDGRCATRGAIVADVLYC